MHTTHSSDVPSSIPVDLFNQLKPQFVAPVVVWLCHESCEDSGGVFEAAGGFVGKYKWSRSQGKSFMPPETLTPESLRDNWNSVTCMSGSSMPSSVHGLCCHLFF